MRQLFLIFSLLVSIALPAELFFTPEMIASHLKGYSEEEIRLIQKDLKVVRSVCLEDQLSSKTPFYLATAGAPGARKTTILEKFLIAHPEYQSGVYIDPDPRTLKFMVHTYYAQSLNPYMISQANSYDEVIKNAYEKWRGASNYIVLSLLEEAFEARQSIVFGTTSTGGHMSIFLANLKKQGYEVVLLLCSCPDNLRYEAVDHRNHTIRFYQSSPEDALSKGTLFPQRMATFFAHADRLYFYWSDALFSPERLAAIWSDGNLEIHDDSAMECFIDKYESDRSTLESQGISIPSFNSFLSNYSSS